MEKLLKFAWILAVWPGLLCAQIVDSRDQQVFALPDSNLKFAGNSAYGHLQCETIVTDSRQIHRLLLDGVEFTLDVPMQASPGHLAFDPKRREFTRLLPSIRIELHENTDLEPVIEALQAASVTEFAPLGFAFVDLPEDLHPVDALAIIAALDGDYEAHVRLPMPPIEWR